MALSLLAVVASGQSWVEQPTVHFSPAQIINWEAHSFQGETSYRRVEHLERDAIHAQCTGGNASARIHRADIDPEQLPIMEWSWLVSGTPEGGEETSRSGDDFAARIYVVEEARLLPWRTRAVNYVWAAEQDVGSNWPNPYQSQAHMVAVRSGPSSGPGAWQSERRDVLRDFRQFHGREPHRITHVAIMTDCDDTGMSRQAWYGGIRFLPR